MRVTFRARGTSWSGIVGIGASGSGRERRRRGIVTATTSETVESR
jgi:hypothetical protein